jgi:hypothetical protein
MDSQLILKRSPIAPDFDYEVLENDVVVGRIFLSPFAPDITRWMWTLAYGHHEDRTPTHGFEPTPETAMAAFVVRDAAAAYRK